jgi:hypothetical protein
MNPRAGLDDWERKKHMLLPQLEIWIINPIANLLHQQCYSNVSEANRVFNMLRKNVHQYNEITVTVTEH